MRPKRCNNDCFCPSYLTADGLTHLVGATTSSRANKKVALTENTENKGNIRTPCTLFLISSYQYSSWLRIFTECNNKIHFSFSHYTQTKFRNLTRTVNKAIECCPELVNICSVENLRIGCHIYYYCLDINSQCCSCSLELSEYFLLGFRT